MKNILATIKELPNCSKFLSLIHKAKLEKVFTGFQPITVFVPSNKGCECLKNKKVLDKDAGKIVKYHIVSGKIKLVELVPFKLRKTFQGKEVCLEAVSVQVNASLITRKDIGCSNGTIHIIDRILAPKNVSCKPRTNYYDYDSVKLI